MAGLKNPQSASIYKLLTFSFIENFDDDIIREHMSNNFSEVFRQYKSIPVSILVEPLARKISQECFGDPTGRMTPKTLVGIENVYF